jgi:hypothetical protein
MKFYLCQTSEGPQLAGTQADAKALDPKYQTVEYAMDKDSIMQRLNDLMRKPSGIRINDEPATADDVIAIGHAMDEEDGGYPEPPVKAKKGAEVTSLTDWGYAPPAGSCERCVAMSSAARKVEGIMALTNVEHTIMHSDEAFLAKVDLAIDDRIKELNIAVD